MYFPLIDFLRLLAAIGVMCFHYYSGSLQGRTGFFDLLVIYGYLGVQLFFIISGFVIYFSLKKSLKEYSLSRFLRLYPLFWVICTVTYVLTRVVPGWPHISFAYFLQNLLIVNNGNTSKMVDGSYWTLTMEILFYFYIGVFVYWFSLKRLEWFYAGWLLLSLLSFYFRFYDMFVFKVLLMRYAPYFVFGGILGLAVEKWGSSSVYAKLRYFIGLLFAALLPIYISHVLKTSILPTTDYFGIFDKYSLLIAESFFIIMPLAVYLCRYVTKRVFIKAAKIAGGITYPLYLMHQQIGSMLISLRSKYGLITFWSLFVAVFMIFAAYLVSVYELKGRKVLHRIFAAKWL
jgi:peptidoglycan/LPS O-acetylase OafA/YrhL